MVLWVLGRVKTAAMAPVSARSFSTASDWAGDRKTVTCIRSAETRQPQARATVGMFPASREARFMETPRWMKAAIASLSNGVDLWISSIG